MALPLKNFIKSAARSSLSSRANRKRICVTPTLLMKVKIFAGRLLTYQPAEDAFGMITPLLLAAAWKSTSWTALLPPKAPLRMSIIRLPCVEKGLVPETPCFKILKVTAVTTALSGREAVSKDTMLRYCLSPAPSPTLNVVCTAFMVPPTLLISVDSSTQPSSTVALKVTFTGLERVLKDQKAVAPALEYFVPAAFTARTCQ